MRRNQGLRARFGVFVKCHFGNQATVLLLPPLRCKIIIIIIVVIITTVAVMFTSRIRANKWWGDQVLLILLMFLLWLSLCFPLEGDSGLILLLSSFFLVSLFFFPLYGLFLLKKKKFSFGDLIDMKCAFLFYFSDFFDLGILDTFIRNEILCSGNSWSGSAVYYRLYFFFSPFFPWCFTNSLIFWIAVLLIVLCWFDSLINGFNC